MSRIVLVTTGGTVASRRDPRSGDTAASVDGDSLRQSLHDPLDGVDLVVDEFCNVSSFAIDLPLAFGLAKRVGRHLADAATSGVVVTHGTDTMEESAYLADLLIASDKPVVFTGAQRAADARDPDGPRNIAEAVRIAASPATIGLGVMVAFEQEFHAARDVTKTHTSRVDAFTSSEHGKLGEIDGERVSVHRRATLRKTFAAERIESRVDLVKLVMGSDGRFLRCAADSGARAIVIEGFGRGNATPAVAKAVAEVIAGGVQVIVASRCPRGRVRPIYGNGGARDLERAGAIFAGDLNGPKARVLAAVMLGAGLSSEAMRTEFDRLGG
jgi:L-asparaginase